MTSEHNLPPVDISSIRRFVTGINTDGQSITAIDDVVSNMKANPHYEGVWSATLWREAAATDFTDHSDGAEVHERIPAGGIQFFLVRIDPGVVVPPHATKSVDCHFVLSGELTCILDTEEFTVRAGEVMVQRGASHGWENRGEVPYISVATMKSTREAPAIAES